MQNEASPKRKESLKGRLFILYNEKHPIHPSFLIEHGIPEKVRLETKLGIKISRLFPTLSFPNERQPFPNKEYLIKTIFEGSSHSDNKISREKITLWFCTCPVLSIFDLLFLPLPSV